MKRIFQLVVSLAILLGSTLPAHATFPGKNGRIAFIQGPDIYTMNPDGSDLRQLTAITGDNSAFFESWSPDGKHIVFREAPGPDFFGQLWIMKADGSGQHLVLSDPGFDDDSPSFSPDGSHILFSRCGPIGTEFPCAVYRVNLDGTGLKAITPLLIQSFDFAPAYSPDGNTIAFESYNRNGVLGAIYVMNSDGSDIHEVTPPAVGGYRVDWSPDGQKLAFSSNCCNPPIPALYSIHKDGRAEKHLTNNGGFYLETAASWSPQGDALVFWRVNTIDGSWGIWIIGEDGKEKLIRTIPARPFRKQNRRISGRSRHANALSTTQIEDGGALPRWGVAQ